MARQHGQALAETLVAMSALMPLFFGLVFVGKVASIQQSTVAAARALAFECAARLDDCARRDQALADEARRRHFTSKDGEVLSPDAPASPLPAAERITYWTDRDGEALLEPGRDVSIAIDDQRFDAAETFVEQALGRRASGALARFGGALSDLIGPGKFGLELSHGMIVAKVQSDVARDAGAQFDSRMKALALAFRARTAILTDGWTASGPAETGDDRSVRDRVELGRHLAPYKQAYAYAAEKQLESAFFGIVARAFKDLAVLKLESSAPVEPARILDRRVLDLLPEDIREQGRP